MADEMLNWASNHGPGIIDPNEKMFLFGYSCKLFPNDDKALYIDQGKHLIPWMGDEKLMIDRYDVRGYLHDLKQFEPKPGGYEPLNSEEEELIDEERYSSLRSDISLEQLYQEEELKRLRAAVACDGAYHEIEFSYDTVENQQPESDSSKVEEPENELYQPPLGLHVPKAMEVPYNMKIHAIIEKTAQFVSDHGGQMEIIIKMKQKSNPQFAFMHIDNPLYPYYKHLISEIKGGGYKPVPVKKVSQSEDEDDDGHYLHPSLMVGHAENVPKFTVPTINFKRSQDDSYSVLVRNLKHHVKEKTPEKEESTIIEKSSQKVTKTVHRNRKKSNHSITMPPSAMRPIIDKMAEYVAKNGEDFETIVKSRNDKRFVFLNPEHEFHNYYIRKRNESKRLVENTPAADSSATLTSDAQIEQTSVSLSNNENNFDTQSYSNELPMQQNKKNSTVEISENTNNKVNSGSPIGSYDEKIPGICEDTGDSLEVTYKEPNVTPQVESSNSMDFLDSPTLQETTFAKGKSKIIGPICFSLKSKESEIANEKPVPIPFLYDDSEDENLDGNTVQPEAKNSPEDTPIHTANFKAIAMDNELKPPKPSNEFLEAKIAEERIRDKLLATARERLAIQRKEKQKEEAKLKEEQERREKTLQIFQKQHEKELQQERKRKAALFLQMLKGRNPDSNAVVSHVLGSEKPVADKKGFDIWTTTEGSSLFSSRKRTVIPGIRNDWDSDSGSAKSGPEVPISEVGDSSSGNEEKTKRIGSVIHKSSSKKRKKNHSKSRDDPYHSKKKHSKKAKERHKSRSPPREYKLEKSKRRKELPAAYSMSARSRSRSRSPKRYKFPPSDYWAKRR